MADPLSILALGVGITDVSVRLIRYLRDVKKAAQTVEDDVDRLISEVEALQVLHGTVEDELKRHLLSKSLTAKENILWFNTGKTLKEGQILTNKLFESVQEIYQEDPSTTGKRDEILEQHRKRSREPRPADFRN